MWVIESIINNKPHFSPSHDAFQNHLLLTSVSNYQTNISQTQYGKPKQYLVMTFSVCTTFKGHII
jgi:hypothetical protein